MLYKSLGVHRISGSYDSVSSESLSVVIPQRSAESRHAPPTAGRHHGQQPPREADLIRDAAIPLTRESYKRKFTALLYLEEDVHDKLLKEK